MILVGFVIYCDYSWPDDYCYPVYCHAELGSGPYGGWCPSSFFVASEIRLIRTVLQSKVTMENHLSIDHFPIYTTSIGYFLLPCLITGGSYSYSLFPRDWVGSGFKVGDA